MRFYLVILLCYPLGLLADECSEAEELVNQAFAKQHYPQQAMPLLRQAIELCPQHGRAHNNLASLYEATGQYNAALYEYRLAAQIAEPRLQAFARIGMGDVYYRQGEFALSLEAYATACISGFLEKEAVLRDYAAKIKQRMQSLLNNCRYRDAEREALLKRDNIALIADKSRHQAMLQATQTCLGTTTYAAAVRTCSANESTSQRSLRIAPRAEKTTRGSVQEYTEQRPQPVVLPPPPEQRLTFRNIQFASGRSVLTPDSQEQLREAAAGLMSGTRGQSGMVLVIEGHSDSDPWEGLSPQESEVKNKWLSKRRAEVVKQALIGYGLFGIQVEVIGYGASRPLMLGNNEAAWAINRRVEMYLKERLAQATY